MMKHAVSGQSSYAFPCYAEKYELFSEKEAAAQLSVIFFMALFQMRSFKKFVMSMVIQTPSNDTYNFIMSYYSKLLIYTASSINGSLFNQILDVTIYINMSKGQHRNPFQGHLTFDKICFKARAMELIFHSRHTHHSALTPQSKEEALFYSYSFLQQPI